MPVKYKEGYDLKSLDEILFSPPEPGNVLYLPGLPGGGSRIYDTSPYGNNGTITGATWKSTGQGLWYLDFDGIDDDVSISDSVSLGITSTLTVLIWAKLGTTDDPWDALFAQYETTLNQRAWHIGGGGGPGQSMYVNISKDGTWQAGVQKSYYTDATVYDNTWRLLGFTFNAGTLKLYNNGIDETVTKDLDDAFVVVHNSTANVTIGCELANGVKGRFLDCLMALPRIWNRALATAEILHLYRQEKNLFGV
jgi:hypothetical protein